MKQFANILWHIPFLGFLRALSTFVLGAFLVLTIIAAPIGLGLIYLSRFYLSPFTSSMVNKNTLKKKESSIDPDSQFGKIMDIAGKLWKVWGVIVRILYLPIGLFMAFINIIFIALEFISLIGIPCALAEVKVLSVWLNPVDKVCVPTSVAEELSSRKSQKNVDKYLD